MQTTIKSTNQDLRIITNTYEKFIINIYNMYTKLYEKPADIIQYQDITISYTDSDTYDSCSDNSDNSDNSSVNSYSSDSSVVTENDSYFRRMRRKDRNRLNIMDIYDNYGQIYVPSGYTTDINKDSPIISYLISKRINNCIMGPSSHIAAFLPSNIDIRSCFISGYRKKGRYR